MFYHQEHVSHTELALSNCENSFDICLLFVCFLLVFIVIKVFSKFLIDFYSSLFTVIAGIMFRCSTYYVSMPLVSRISDVGR